MKDENNMVSATACNSARSTACNTEVDYSQVEGNRILPFVFTLNLEESILFPQTGQQQKFCYDVEGVGQDTSGFADLSHFLLGICDTITQEDIANITVVVDGQEKTVIWGTNVEIKTADHPDNPTGCIGLKFDFPLNKVDGMMRVCITMETPFAVGPVNVCVFGGNTTATGLMICGPVCGNQESCEAVFFQKEKVCVPVKVTPFANPGMATATCCGEPSVVVGGQCQGNRTSCDFTITQTLCIEIPISFGAVIETGAAVVQCGDVTKEPCDCSDDTIRNIPSNNTDTNIEMNDRRYFYRK